MTTTGNVPLSSVNVSDNIAGVDPTPVLSGADNVGDTNQDGLLEAGETWVFTASGTATAGQYSNIGTGGTPSDAKSTHSRCSQQTASNPDNDDGYTTNINIVKLTNGTDNDNAPGLYVPVGNAVTWTYDVTTTGNVPLSGVAVSDSVAGVDPTPVLSGGFNVGDTNHDGLLEAGETWVFTASGTAIAGQYTNIGTAVGTPSTPAVRRSRGFPAKGHQPRQLLRLHDQHQHRQADQRHGQQQRPRPVRSRRQPVTWTYDVTTTGNVPLSGVAVSDSVAGVDPTPVLSGGFNVGDTNHDGLLEAGETWVFTASGTAIAGQYTNIGTAVGTPSDSTVCVSPGALAPKTATNPDNYYGYTTNISIVKLTNGTNNDNAPGLYVPVGMRRHLDLRRDDDGQRPAFRRGRQRQRRGRRPHAGPLRRFQRRRYQSRRSAGGGRDVGVHRQRHGHSRPVQQRRHGRRHAVDPSGTPIPALPSRRPPTPTTTTATRRTSASSS